MTKEEVILRLREHLKAKKQKFGKITKGDKSYCLDYIEDFLFVSREEAEIIYSEIIRQRVTDSQ